MKRKNVLLKEKKGNISKEDTSKRKRKRKGRKEGRKKERKRKENGKENGKGKENVEGKDGNLKGK